MKIAIGNDHAAVEMKHHIVKYLQEKGHEVLNFGIDVVERTDYPARAEDVAKAVVSGQAERGIVICGTGVGMSMAANKIKGIRAACVSDCFSAEATRAHNDANIVCFGQRVVGEGLAFKIVDTFLDTKFEGGRHQIRIDMVNELDNK